MAMETETETSYRVDPKAVAEAMLRLPHVVRLLAAAPLTPTGGAHSPRASLPSRPRA
jgi:hypothetical protein